MSDAKPDVNPAVNVSADVSADVPTAAALSSASAMRVQQALHDLGVDVHVRELSSSARTAQQAADSLGVPVGAIAKSLIFQGAESLQGVLVVCAGDRRVDEAKVSAALGEPIARAKPAFVKQVTGYAIGGIPPVGHATQLRVLIDASLARFETVWAAGGTPHAVFPIAPQTLFAIVAGQVTDVTELVDPSPAAPL